MATKNVDTESEATPADEHTEAVKDLIAEVDVLFQDYAERGLTFQEMSDILVARGRVFDRRMSRKLAIDDCEDEVGESIDVSVTDSE